MFFRVWQTIRLAFLMLVFIGLGGFLVLTTPWHRWFGQLPDYGVERRAGQPIVDAVYRFKGETGLWPEYLNDVVPRYLREAPPPTWYYTVGVEGPALSVPIAQRRTHVGFDFDAVHPHWQVFGEVDNRVLPEVHAVLDVGTTLPAEEGVQRELAELDRRIAREPRMIEHRQGKAALLRSLQRHKEARVVIGESGDALPQSFWPPLALASMNGTPETFAQWVAGHPSFTHQYYLALLEREKGDDAKALAILREGLEQSVAVGAEDPNTLSFYLWDETRYALAQKDYVLVRAITEVWKKAREAHLATDNSDLTLRAAAELAIGDIAAAKRTMAELAAAPKPETAPWSKHVDALRRAVEDGDVHFVYDPGASPPPYAIFALPQ